MSKQNEVASLSVRALRTKQGKDVDVYSFFLPGSAILEVAEISRIERKASGVLKGFQRRDIKRHVAAITAFLDQGPALFPNSIILALSSPPRFVQSRGPSPKELVTDAQAGIIQLPVGARRAGWIVDGQQRALALSKAKNKNTPVPVVAFVSNEISVHREQFILVNKAKPLSPRLVDELLPEVDSYLPRDLAQRQIPSALVDMLNSQDGSPFKGLIKRASSAANATSVVTDSVLVASIRRHIETPLGALAQYKSCGNSGSDVGAMYKVLVSYWSIVSTVFANAWGKHPSQSRLMHSAGISAMSVLLDRLVTRAPTGVPMEEHLRSSIRRIAPACCWTHGRWPDLGRNWNDIQFTPRDAKALADQLVRLDMTAQVSRAA